MADAAEDFHFAEDYSVAPLEEDCNLLKTVLDDVLAIECGEELLAKLKKIKMLSLCSQNLRMVAETGASDILSDMLQKDLQELPAEQAMPLARACAHYLNLTSIAEVHHRERNLRRAGANHTEQALIDLLDKGFTPDQVYDCVASQKMEVVLTAHPTQVNRRSLLSKHNKIARLLAENDRVGLSPMEREELIHKLVCEITSIWQTDEIRKQKPTPVDEARGGLHIVEGSLWEAVPAYLRRLSKSMKRTIGRELPITAAPIQFSSWIGGDRDGNPNVTHRVTHDVVCMSRWMAAGLYIAEVDKLLVELSMTNCSDEVWRMADEILSARTGAEDGDGLDGAKSPTFETAPADVNNGSEMSFSKAHNHLLDRDQLIRSLESLDQEGKNVPRQQSRPLPLVDGQDALEGSYLQSHPVTGDTQALVSKSKSKTLTTATKGSGTRSAIDEMLKPPDDRTTTPYRVVLGEVRRVLVCTRQRMEDILAGQRPSADDPWYETAEQLAAPLLAVYWSLWECGSGVVADGRLLDTLRRVYAFDMCLMKLDIRQEAPRHEDAINAITEYLEIGSYKDWDEDTKVKWLVKELEGRRPLLSPLMELSEEVKEVLETFHVVAELGSGSLGAYVISMASLASDVLAVELLQRECRNQLRGKQGAAAPHHSLRVAPLFETLDDLAGAGVVMEGLLSNPWYRKHLHTMHNDCQEIMLGYSDSGKDAGRLAANWALYKCQEEVLAVCNKHGVKLTLFHGRGGTIGRGGGPLKLAMQSQPPGSVQGTLRLTEQGEVIQAKFGIPSVAVATLETYTTAILSCTLMPPAAPPPDHPWRTLMETMGEVSCEAYRQVVFKDPTFIKYFANATPQEHLGGLNIGSRPSRRKASGGVTQLRAIPWIFAWTQTRMNLPVWLGMKEAFEWAADNGSLPELHQMYAHWPFFQSTIDLVEMNLAKANMPVASLYDKVLVTDAEEIALGQSLHSRFEDSVKAFLAITGHHRLCEHNPSLRRMLEMRDPSITPLNMLQVEMMRRLREDPENPELNEVMRLTIAGIAVGMRNTG
mmetsp:Transcript_15331/g.38379  ORF Transcript_15331/g.38379 Transcript_15331/m.38379 type:complete len:1041 (+) Transcript_15331:121-3243(+)